MPITTGAIRKQRADKRKAKMNATVRRAVVRAVALARKKPTAKNYQVAASRLDRAAKIGIIHKNRASRLKSRLSKLQVKKSKS